MLHLYHPAHPAVLRILMRLQRHNLIYPALMLATLELGAHKRIQILLHLLYAQHACAHAHNIGVVVLFGHLRAVSIADKRRTDAMAFVGRQRHSNAGSAYQNAPICLPILHLFTHCLCKHRIVHRILGITAQIADLLPFFFQVVDKLLSLLYACVVRTNGNHTLFPSSPVQIVRIN